MLKIYGKRRVIEFQKDENKAMALLRRFYRRKLICAWEIEKLCKSMYSEDWKPCILALKSCLNFQKIQLTEADESELIKGNITKTALLNLLDCGYISSDNPNPKIFLAILNFYILKESIRGLSSAKISLEGEINGTAIKRALFLAKKTRLPLDIYVEEDYVKLNIWVPKSMINDPFSSQYKIAPEIIATILSLTRNWRAEFSFPDKSYLKLRSDSPWIADFKPPWMFTSSTASFDSRVELVVYEALKELGVEVKREPKLLVVGKKIIIPDFTVLLNGQEFVIEVVGFWTKEYLRKKEEKLRELRENLIVIVDRRLKLNLRNARVIKYDYPPKKSEIILELRKVLEEH